MKGSDNGLDAVDSAILAERRAAFDAVPGPRVGDFVTVDGKTSRFTHDWNDSIQTGGGGSGFYLGRDGHVSYSGGLDPALPKSRMVDTGETRDGTFWFFRHNEMRAHNSVYVSVPCRVFRYVPA